MHELREFKQFYGSLLKANWFTTLVYCSNYLTFGLSVGFLGPTVVDLKCMLHASEEDMAWTFFGQILFTMCGNILSGMLMKKVSPILLLLISSALLSICMAIMPFCTAIWALSFLLCFMGLNMGAVDNLDVQMMVNLYGPYLAPFLQLMYFFYGIGAFLSPLIEEPFLSDTDCDRFGFVLERGMSYYVPLNMTHSIFRDPTGRNRTVMIVPAPPRTIYSSKVRYAFWIFAMIQLMSPVLVGILFAKTGFSIYSSPLNDDAANADNASEYEEGGLSEKSALLRKMASFKQFVLSIELFPMATGLLAALLALIFDGLQASYSDYVYTFASKTNALKTMSKSAFLTAEFWGMFAFGRLVSVFLSMRFSSATLLLVAAVGGFTATTMLLASNYTIPSLTAGTCLFGLFLGNATPSVIAFCEQYFGLSSGMTTLLIVSATLGEMTFPVLTGNVIAAYGPKSFIVFHVVVCLIAAGVIALFLIAAKRTDKGCQQDSLVWTSVGPTYARRSSKQEGAAAAASAQFYLRMQYADCNEEVSDSGTPHSEVSSLNHNSASGNSNGHHPILFPNAQMQP